MITAKKKLIAALSVVLAVLCLSSCNAFRSVAVKDEITKSGVLEYNGEKYTVLDSRWSMSPEYEFKTDNELIPYKGATLSIKVYNNPLAQDFICWNSTEMLFVKDGYTMPDTDRLYRLPITMTDREETFYCYDYEDEYFAEMEKILSSPHESATDAEITSYKNLATVFYEYENCPLMYSVGNLRTYEHRNYYIELFDDGTLIEVDPDSIIVTETEKWLNRY